MFIDKPVIFTEKQRIVLQFLLKLPKFYAVTILTYGLSKSKNELLIKISKKTILIQN